MLSQKNSDFNNSFMLNPTAWYFSYHNFQKQNQLFISY
jgi:hypothetical protein